jgi:phosphoglycerate dehydrogenase-like enzyme
VLTLAVAQSAAETVRDRAQARGLDVRVVGVTPDGRLLEADASPEVALRSGSLTGESLRALLRACPTIRWVHAVSAGVDVVLSPEVLERDVIVTRTRGLHDRTVSEFAMALVLLAAKRLREALAAQQRREWIELAPAQLAGATLTVVGYGEIGRAVARRARAFEMRVLGVRKHPRPDDVADEVVGVDRLADVLARSDYVVLCAPLTSETRHLIGPAELRAMPAHAVLVNVGRGELVDEAALEAALRNGHPRLALLDTFSVEPLPPGHPLWSNPRVVVTPHAAGVRMSHLHSTALDQFLDNLQRYLRGQPLLNVVDKRLGY